MVIKLYRNASPPEKIGKSLSNSNPMNGTLRDSTNLLDPVIMFEADNLSGYNYMYIPSFNRYYFIKSIDVVRTGLWRVSGHVDVLESFKTAIKSNTVILSDSETYSNVYLSGEQWRTTVKTKIDVVSFSSGFNNAGEYILITAGG